MLRFPYTRITVYRNSRRQARERRAVSVERGKMKRLFGWIFAALFVFVVVLGVVNVIGGLKSIKNEKGNRIDAKELDLVRKRIYLKPGTKLEVLGFKTESGLDEAFWIVFSTRENINDLFQDQIVNIKSLEEEFEFINVIGESWWLKEGTKISGKQFLLPNAKVLNVGVSKTKEGNLIYIFWHST